jgi:hypothetical protein
MYQFFLICLTIGGTILVLRLALSLLGIGFDSLDGVVGDLGDADVDAGLGDDVPAEDGQGYHTDLGRIFTFQAIVSFLAFFGVGGLAALESKQHPAVAVLIGSATGFVAVSLLGYVLGGLRKLNTDGTVQISRAVGLEGKVYLRIPANGDGEGKITLPIQGRTIEILARTPGPGLRAGDPVVVSRIIDAHIVEVVMSPCHVAKPAAFAE